MTFANEIRLSIETVKRTVVMDQDGPRFVHGYRLMTHFLLFAQGSPHRGLIDTGATLTVLPEAVWKPHEQVLERVTAPPGLELPEWLLFVSGIGRSQRIECDPAFVQIHFFDSELRVLKSRRVLVKCAHDRGKIEQSLIGLGGHVLDECRLEVEYKASSVDLKEKQPAWLREMESRPA